MIIEFDSDEEYEKFIEYATSTEKPQGEEWDRLRKEFRNHKRAKQSSEVGWRRMKEIAQKAMVKGDFTIDDVREDLKKLRETYEDDDEHDPKESLRQALIEVKLIREGKLPYKTWQQYLDEQKGKMMSDFNGEEVVNNMSIQEMEELLGLDKIKPIQLTPSDTKRVEEDAEYFRPMYEDELRDRVREMFAEDIHAQGDKLNDELVQYFVVNSELNMSVGKVAAQVAHVAVNIASKLSVVGDYWDSNVGGKFVFWFNNNQPKIILRGKQKDLEKLIEKGWYYIRDNGRTEIEPNSLTVVGFHPEYKSIMKQIVKRFQLL